MKVAQGHVTEAKKPKKRTAVLFFHKSISDMSKMSFEGFFGMLIPILNSKIQLDVIQTHEGCSRSRCKGQMLEKYLTVP